jgi:hypothetical protein
MRRYFNIPITKIQGKESYVTARYPEVPLSEDDIYVYTTIGDRYDTLAQQYYQDSTLWWIIAIANPDQGLGSTTPPIGAQIRIPANPQAVLSSFNSIN